LTFLSINDRPSNKNIFKLNNPAILDLEFKTNQNYISILATNYMTTVMTNFAIVNFPFLCSNIPLSPVYGVCISKLIR
jgi:hypothetical protein